MVTFSNILPLFLAKRNPFFEGKNPNDHHVNFPTVRLSRWMLCVKLTLEAAAAGSAVARLLSAFDGVLLKELEKLSLSKQRRLQGKCCSKAFLY